MFNNKLKEDFIKSLFFQLFLSFFIRLTGFATPNFDSFHPALIMQNLFTAKPTVNLLFWI
jgi:hypothetical protein